MAQQQRAQGPSDPEATGGGSSDAPDNFGNGGLVGDGQTGAEGLPAGAEVLEEPLEPRGSLVAVRLPGGSACQSSA